MGQFLDVVKKLEDAEAEKKVALSDDERFWLVANILILAEKAGLVTFKVPSPKSRRARQTVLLPKGLMNLLKACVEK